jgi:hypothetical protein
VAESTKMIAGFTKTIADSALQKYVLGNLATFAARKRYNPKTIKL